MDVLGENEALQQFFDGQDLSGVLERAAVDTSILEQYLSNEIDPTFMLPDSPPDSSSEPCSPQILGVQSGSDCQPGQIGHAMPRPVGGDSTGLFQESVTSVPLCHQHQHSAAQQLVKSSSPALAHSTCSVSTSIPRYISPAEGRAQASTAPPAPPPPAAGDAGKRVDAVGSYGKSSVSTPFQDLYSVPNPGQNTETSPERKRRRPLGSFDGALDHQHQWGSSVWTKTSLHPEGGSCEMPGYEGDAQGASPGMGVYQLLMWDSYQPSQWSSLYNHSYQTLPPVGYHVDTDKGFSYSAFDEAFVCQKKNHFQVTVHIGMAGEPQYVATPVGPMPVESFQLRVFGVKMEAQNHHVTIEQSQADRSKKPFQPVQVNLPGNKITKVTLGRLHFGETTANNMRKKGKPNPDQRYFLMVVGLYAAVEGKTYLLVANISERIIVRASSPGQFENDSEVLWQKGQSPDAVVCQGRVGINTDTPEEALVVCGNARIMGTVMHPSDGRAKDNIQEVDSTDQLRRIAQMRIVEYDYKPEFATKMGIDHMHETGVIAQEVRELLPAAVREVGEVTCSDGQKIHNFLMVDKEQIFMENVGAVKQLCKLTDNLETRIQELEVWNTRQVKPKNPGTVHSRMSSAASGKVPKIIKTQTSDLPQTPSILKGGKEFVCEKYRSCLHHRIFQTAAIMFLGIMAFCAIGITSLYMLTLRDDLDYGSGTSNSTVFPVYSTTEQLPTVSPTAPPEPGPPDVDFSNVFFSDEVYCCPPPATPRTSRVVGTRATLTPDGLGVSEDADHKTADQTWRELQRHYSDWTNTTIQSIFITQNQQFIDHHYIEPHLSGKGNYSYRIPISKHIPLNMPITLQMNSTELMVVHLCGYDLAEKCTAFLEEYLGSLFSTFPNTQGYVHQWTLPATQNYRSSFHFRVAVAGQADCTTDPNYVEILFTDYHFHFYRRCQ